MDKIEYFRNKKKIFESINLFFVLLITFLLPFHKNIPEITIFCFFIWILGCSWENRLEENRRHKTIFWLCIVYFSYSLLSLLFFDFFIELKQIEKRAGFLIFPIIFFLGKEFFGNEVLYIIYSYVLGCFLKCVFSIFNAFDTNSFFYIRFAGENPTWFSMYMSLALALTIYLLLRKNRREITCILMLFLMTFLVSNYLASSRTGFISTIAILFFYSIFVSFKYTQRIIKFAIFSSLLITMFFFYNNPRTERLKSNYDKSARIFLWHAGFNVIKEMPKNPRALFLGYGTKEGTKKFKEKLQNETGLSNHFKNFLSAPHNEFINIFIKKGLLGFILILSTFVLSTLKAIRDKNFIFLNFILIAFIHFTFDTILESRMGSYFFPFFYSFLFFSFNAKKINKNLI